jgi:DNA topoisomerase I
MSNLVIVESPAKARTLAQILGKNYVIKASMGHVRDLPQKSLGISVDDNFRPQYSVITQKRKLVSELKEAAREANTVYLATDPDREGEAISWHLVEAAKLKDIEAPIKRVVFHEITSDAVQEAFKKPRTIDMDLVNAQQARRLLDRLVGYKLSPLLWRKVMKGLSAGRVQSAALRIIVDREREIQKFVPVEYWTIDVELSKYQNVKLEQKFQASVFATINRKSINIHSKDEAESVSGILRKSAYSVESVQLKKVPRLPSPPFTTSTMQQEASRRLHYTALRTMAIAQQLYEGIAIGDEGTVGLITYMRTDSLHVAPVALEETRDFVKDKYGANYVPAKARVYKTKTKFSQEAHEAIRPTRIHREPESIRQYLKPEQFRLYDLIWKRMVASQMSEAIYDTAAIEILAKSQKDPGYLLKTNSSKIQFAGFTILYSEGKDEEEPDESKSLPKLEEKESLKYVDLNLKQNFTEPLPRYTEATLIKAMEQKGIGRPSTYAPTISTIQTRDYVHKESGKFKPGDIGFVVNDLLVENFPTIVDLNFTAKVENDLDEVATGKKDWVSLLKEFYIPFENTLKDAAERITKVKMDKETDMVCPDCGKPMVIKRGRFGEFLACSGYPECKKTMKILVKVGVACPTCGEKDKGEIIQRRNKKKKIFYGCSRYPDCTFITNYKPLNQKCPECGKTLFLFRKNQAKCLSCDYKGEVELSE